MMSHVRDGLTEHTYTQTDTIHVNVLMMIQPVLGYILAKWDLRPVRSRSGSLSLLVESYFQTNVVHTYVLSL